MLTPQAVMRNDPVLIASPTTPVLAPPEQLDVPQVETEMAAPITVEPEKKKEIKTLAELLNPNEEEELRSMNHNPSQTPGIFDHQRKSKEIELNSNSKQSMAGTAYLLSPCGGSMLETQPTASNKHESRIAKMHEARQKLMKKNSMALAELAMPPKFVFKKNDIKNVRNGTPSAEEITRQEKQRRETSYGVIDYPRHLRFSSEIQSIA